MLFKIYHNKILPTGHAFLFWFHMSFKVDSNRKMAYALEMHDIYENCVLSKIEDDRFKWKICADIKKASRRLHEISLFSMGMR